MALISLDKSICNKPAASEPKQMLQVDKLADGTTHIRINYSSLNIIMQCLRKAHYALIRNIGPKHESPAVIFGTAIHEALEVFYSAPREDRILPTNFEKNFELLAYGGEVADSDSYLLYRAAKAFIRRAEPLSNLPAEDKRSIANGLWILTHYFKNYINDPYAVHSDADGPIVERLLEHELHSEPGLKISIFGTIDVVLKNIANEQILVCDHKTSSVVGNDFYNRLKPNHQYTAYTWLAQKELGLGTEKFMVNCLQVKPKPKTARGTAPNFPRQITTRTAEDIEEFKAAVIHHVKSLLQCLESGVWPIGTVESCTAYGGCTYLTVCSAPNSIKENIISAEFKQGVYS